jgi:hypothetical protein
VDIVQKSQLKVSEIKAKITGLLETAEEKRSEDYDGDLEKAMKLVRPAEVALQAALLAQPEETAEKVEKRAEVVTETAEEKAEVELRSKVDFGRYVAASLAGTGVTSGAEGELNEHLGLAANQFPMDMLAPPVEKRALRDGDSEVNARSWVDRVFADSAAMRLGISFNSVPAGTAAYPIMTAGGNPAQRGRTQAAGEETYTFAVSELKPTRMAVHAIYSTEDSARVPGLSDAILRDMRSAIVEKTDRVIFRGDDGANEDGADIDGLEDLTITERTITQTNKVKGPETLQAFLHFVDGIYASGLTDLSVVAAQGANTLWYSTIHNSSADNQTVAKFLMDAGLSWMVRGHIESNTANGDFGAFIGLARGMAGAGVAPVWNRGELVRDPYSNANKGEVKLTVNWLWNFGLVRAANFARIKFVSN